MAPQTETGPPVILLTLCSPVLLLWNLSCSFIPGKDEPVECRVNAFIIQILSVNTCRYSCVLNLLLCVPIGDLLQDPDPADGEQGRMRGEQGTESRSLMLSSADDVSDRRESSGGTRLPDMVRTRGEPQGSSQPLSTVWADFWKKSRQRSVRGKGKVGGRTTRSKGCFPLFLLYYFMDFNTGFHPDPLQISGTGCHLIHMIKTLKLQAVCWCSPAGTSLQGKGQKASGPYSYRSCYTGGNGRRAPCLAHLEHKTARLEQFLDRRHTRIRLTTSNGKLT